MAEAAAGDAANASLQAERRYRKAHVAPQHNRATRARDGSVRNAAAKYSAGTSAETDRVTHFTSSTTAANHCHRRPGKRAPGILPGNGANSVSAPGDCRKNAD